MIFGLSKIGVVQVPINTAHKGELLTYLINQSESEMLVVDSRYVDRVEQLLSNTRGLRTIVVIDRLQKGIPPVLNKILDWSSLVDNSGVYQAEDILWSDPFIIIFTSGTTGPSKGSLMPHNYVLFMGDVICESMAYTGDDCLYNALPLFHGNALLLSTIPALMSGARMVLAERFSASQFWEDVKKYNCTEFNYIGGILSILLKAEPRSNDADNPLRCLFGGGASKEICETFEKRFGVSLTEGYGMSEIGLPLMSKPGARRPGSCGKVHKDYQVKVVDDNGMEVGPKTIGEILVRPLKPYSMLLEYFGMPEKTIETWRDLWFHCGDYMYFDEEGYFYFVDRKKDALRRLGENISSYEVERGIYAHPAVLECAAVAAKSDLGEDEVMACVVLKDDLKLTPEELIVHCEDRMAYFMIPRYIRFMAALPKTPTERVQKFALREEGITKDTWDRVKAGYKLKR